MSLLTKKAVLLKQLEQIATLEKAMLKHKLIEHESVNTFVDDKEQTIVITLTNNDQLLCTKYQLVKIRLNGTDSFINFSLAMYLSDSMKKDLVIDILAIELECLFNVNDTTEVKPIVKALCKKYMTYVE